MIKRNSYGPVLDKARIRRKRISKDNVNDSHYDVLYAADSANIEVY